MTEYGSSGLEAITIEPGKEAEAWRKICQSCCNLTDWGVQTLRAGLDGIVGTAIVEPSYVCKDFRSLYSNFYSKKFLERSSRCNRLHFFSKPGVSVYDAVFAADAIGDCYIGYSVIQPIRNRCIGRTMIDPYQLGRSRESFFCLQTATRAHLNGTKYVVHGYPYHSQSGEPIVCAHAALWGVCRYLSDRYSVYGEVYPYDLIEMTGTTFGRRVPYRKMTYADYSEILSTFGCYPIIVRPRNTDQKDWTKDEQTFYDIYAYVESGFPVLASFRGHVATIIGHTLSDHLCTHAVETSRFYNSFLLLKQFIVMDDNFFPYQLLGYPSDPDNYGQHFTRLTPTPSIESIFAAVVPLPEKAFLPPRQARALAYRYFDHADGNRLLDDALELLNVKQDDPLIARLFLTSCISFKKRKRLCAEGSLGEAPDDLSKLPVDLNLPHFIWVMEISPLSVYNKGLCIGEVVLDASASEEECEYIYMRVGKSVLCGDKESVYEDGLVSFPQYTHNLGEREQ